MMKTCGTCHHTGEPTWRDGTYYCAMCGAVIDMTTPSPAQPPVSTAAAPVGTAIVATCPICRNSSGNTLVGGRCRCALCGTTFDYAAPVMQPQMNYQANVGYGQQNAYRAQLEKQKKHHLGWGIFWFFVFWPIAVYQFYKMWQVSEEIRRLEFNRY